MSGLGGLRAGTVIAGDFEILRPLSEGGMGAVHVVMQRSTGHERALKVMHTQLVANADLRAKFLREAKISAKIDSEHVVQIIAAGIDEESQAPWLVMELLRGQELRSFIDEGGPPSPAEAHDIFTQLCHGLAAAHRVGVIHRDLKPDNIFLATSSRKDTPFTVKILDFGIAKIVADSKSHGSIVIGSPYWMAPEQTQVGVEISAATDVWALGLIAFFMLTGKVFWRAAEAPDSTPLMVMTELVLGDLPAASVRAGELGCADRLPAGFDGWFAKAVVRDASQRFPDADAASSAFEALFDSTQSVKPSTGSVAVQPPAAAAALTRLGPDARTLASAAATQVADPSALPAPMPVTMARQASASTARSKVPMTALVAIAVVVPLAGAGLWLGLRDSKPSSPAGEKRDEPEAHADATSSAEPRGKSSASASKKSSSLEAMKLFWDRSDPVNLAKSIVMLREACDAKSPTGCAGLAFAMHEGRGIPKDDAAAYRLLDRACKAGSLLGCAGLGYAFQTGRGVDKDDQRALENLEKACNGDQMVGCRLLAASYEHGKSVAQDPKRANELYRNACRGGDKYSCTELGAAYMQGDGVPKDENRATDYFRKSCEGGRMVGCAALGNAYEHGIGVTKNQKRAAELYEKACDAEVARACKAKKALAASLREK